MCHQTIDSLPNGWGASICIVVPLQQSRCSLAVFWYNRHLIEPHVFGLIARLRMVLGMTRRRDQSKQRKETTAKADWDFAKNGKKILKLNPLIDWSIEDVEQYSQKNDLPYNKLYDFVSPYGEKYSVIGCKPCHIPVREELGRRAGKFPWEQGNKECGLHKDGSGI